MSDFVGEFVAKHPGLSIFAVLGFIFFGLFWVTSKNLENMKTGCANAGGSYRILGEDDGHTTRRCVDSDGNVVPFEYPQ